jgi:hypothetical protein
MPRAVRHRRGTSGRLLRYIVRTDKHDIAQAELIIAPDSALAASIGRHRSQHLIAHLQMAAGHVLRQRIDVYLDSRLCGGEVGFFQVM